MFGRVLPELNWSIYVRIAIDGGVGIGTSSLGVGIEGIEGHMVGLSLGISHGAIALEVDVIHVIFMRKGRDFRSAGTVGVVLASCLA